MNEKVIEIINIDKIKERDILLLKEKLPVRFEKAERILDKKERLKSIGAGLLLVKNFPNRKDEDFYYNEFGKPFIREEKYFSISHSGSISAISVSEDIIGIDIERIRDIDLKKAKKVCVKEELEFINDNELEGFFKVFTLKEAVMKALGLGFNLSPKSFSVINLLHNEPIEINGKVLYGKNVIFNGYVVSMVSINPIDKITIKE